MQINGVTDVHLLDYSFDDLSVDSSWSGASEKESLIHTIHNYPARFPSFIVDKAIDYTNSVLGRRIKKISDVFCGCGTVALESRINGIDFWGCDINPVATLIARTKASVYDLNVLKKTEDKIFKKIEEKSNVSSYETANERIRYWFDEESFYELERVKSAIMALPPSKYRNAFLCVFSSILKSSSRWLTKSIKPQVDPNKKTGQPIILFKNASRRFIEVIEKEHITNAAKIIIENCNYLTKKNCPKVDLLVTSPPYVTSYEYADLHQLSTLWLGFSDDYKELRKGTIGSVYNCNDYYFEIMDLNETAKSIIQKMYISNEIGKAKTKSVARYFIDMQYAAGKCYQMLSEDGVAFFIIGDTEYKGIRVENARHLVESLSEAGFVRFDISKRQISRKTLSPYRDSKGKFSSDSSERKVYHEEYVIIAHKK